MIFLPHALTPIGLQITAMIERTLYATEVHTDPKRYFYSEFTT